MGVIHRAASFRKLPSRHDLVECNGTIRVVGVNLEMDDVRHGLVSSVCGKYTVGTVEYANTA